MAGVPPIAPLLCSTPPPIDFGEEDDDSGLPPTLTLEDDDEYGDFAFAADINENATNTDIPSLPRTPLQFELSSSTTSGFTDVPPSLEECGNAPITPPPLQTEHDVCSAREEVKLELIEAINYNVVSRETNQERISDGITNVDETSNTNDSVTSHPQPEKDNNWVIHNLSDTKITNETCAESESLPKFAHTTDAITTKEKSGTKNVSILSNEQEIKAQPNAITIFPEIPPPLTQLVLLEDIADDSSDEECHGSPKKSTISTTSPFTSSADINSADFFAIHVIGAPSSTKEDKPLTKVEDINMNSLSNHDNNITHEFENITKTTPYGGEELNDDFGDFADFESATEITNPTTCPMKTADSNVITKSDCNDVEPVGELPVESTTQNNDDENDFDDFQDFCSAPTSVSDTKPIISSQNSEGVAATCNDGIKKGIALNENSLATLKIDSESQAKEVENSDDDDFGDFEEASLAIPTSEFTANTAIMNTHTPPATSGNISDRIGSVLKLMFPPAEECVDSDKERTAPDALSSLQLPNGTLPFESIEAAKALEFQWPQSEIRHALVRSIGIDSRNILFGENWNPSMPRFAANLSFNPLKPLKPQTVNPSTTTAGIDSEHYSNGSDVSNYSMKTDVPDVEFDWQSAGLVNPLDGVKGETNTRETET
ncbi:PREDICTED: aftiphilin-like, partial [Rhagoletis zephyria]|uniref:aftiphilin-like n=1 Tax=Rhagoletis zephyria TaxID=28612 RepID=UPI0008117AA2